MKRLFFALWPDEATRTKLVSVSQSITAQGLRKFKPHNLHVTLVFLGNVNDDVAKAVEADAAHIIATPFSFSFDTLEFWAKPGILCLTASEQPAELYDLVERLTEMVAAYPVQMEQRPYRAHVTLARKAKADFRLDFETIRWQAKEFALVQSQSTGVGVQYDVIARWPLLNAR